MRLAATIFLAVCPMGAGSRFAPAVAKWNRPVAAFRVAGNIYYVGASDVSSYLITTPQGHILLDTGFRETVPMIEANVRKLGFRVEDIRLLLISHAHYDHVGGIAAVKARTGAKLLANPADAPLLKRGGTGDFAFGDRFPYPPAMPDRLLHDGEEVRLGDTVMTAHFTPGHTKGCTTWTTVVTDGGKSLHVVFPCSVSAPGYQLVNNQKYPEIIADFEHSIATLRALPCDIFLGLHSWEFDLPGKMAAKAGNSASNPFVDPEGYGRYLDRAQAAIEEAIEKQKNGGR
jgi:metallo-beta-lactamase class B